MQKFSGEGDTPSPDPIPLGAYGASIFAPTALKLNMTPPEKNPSYGLASRFSFLTTLTNDGLTNVFYFNFRVFRST